MIPLTNNYFFTGIVEDVNDPDQMGRLRVRVIGIHTEDKSMIPTDMLPWADVCMPITSANISGVGTAPVGIVEGTMVMGIFLDGSDFQQPVIMFTLGSHRTRNKSNTFGFNSTDDVYPIADYGQDINKLAGGKMSDTARNRSDNAIPEQRADGEAIISEADAALAKDTPWMKIAMGEIGVNEEQNAARIKEYHSLGGGANSNEGVPWCSSFIGYCLEKSDYTGTKSAMARSYLRYGKDVGTTEIPYGAIGVLEGNRGANSGHVVFITKDLGNKIEVIGGNQTTSLEGGKAVKYDTGGKVTRITFPKTKLLGCHFPTEANKKT